MNPEIVVVGSLNNDVVLRVPNLPRAGETVTGATLYYAGGGKVPIRPSPPPGWERQSPS